MDVWFGYVLPDLKTTQIFYTRWLQVTTRFSGLLSTKNHYPVGNRANKICIALSWNDKYTRLLGCPRNKLNETLLARMISCSEHRALLRSTVAHANSPHCSPVHGWPRSAMRCVRTSTCFGANSTDDEECANACRNKSLLSRTNDSQALNAIMPLEKWPKLTTSHLSRPARIATAPPPGRHSSASNRTAAASGRSAHSNRTNLK